MRDVKINIPGAAKSRLSRALFPLPPLRQTPRAPLQYKTFNLNVKLKRNGFRCGGVGGGRDSDLVCSGPCVPEFPEAGVGPKKVQMYHRSADWGCIFMV